MQNNISLFERAKKVSPGGVHSPVRAFKNVGGVPPFICEAKKAHLIDVEGNSYTDYCMAWGPLIFGHQDEEIQNAIMQALHRGWSFGTVEPYSLELAELISSKIPWAEKIRFVNSGTEAVMSALRVARAATGRNKILKFEGCYHGHCDSMLVRAGSGLAEMTTADSAGVSQQVASETIVASLDDLSMVENIFEKLGKEIAAVIVEPVPANYGLLLQKDSFLKNIERIAHHHGALLIFDEVITGFRVSFGGMAELTGITPDLVTYGKVVGGGFPVGAYAGKAHLMDLVSPIGSVYQAGTLSANPIAMCAGLATLKKLWRENPYQKLASTTNALCVAIEEIAKNHLSIPLKTQTIASMFWFIFGEIKTQDQRVRKVSHIPQNHREVFSKIFHSLLKQGYYLPPSSFEVCFLSTAHTTEDNQGFMEAFKQALQEFA